MASKVICFQQERGYRQWAKQHGVPAGARVFMPADMAYRWNEEDRRDFLKAYVDTVGQLSAFNHSLLWWATDLSSKNSFLSPLADPLEKFFKTARLIQRSDDEVLIFVGLPWSLRGSLRDFLKKHGAAFLWYGRGPDLYGVRVKQWLLLWGRIIRHIFYILPRILSARRVLAPTLLRAKKDRSPVYAFKTFIMSRAFDGAGAYKDMFFGSLVDFIMARRRVLVLAEVTDDFTRTIALMRRFGQGRIYPLELFLTVGDVLRASARMLTYTIRVPVRLDFAGYDAADLVACVCLDGGHKIQPVQLYHYYAMSRFLKDFKVDTFTFTCEFNPWEKMCLWAIKQCAPAIRTLGYQHTVVPQASPNMFTSGFEEDIIPKPDKLLTVGQRPKEIIHRYETCTTSAIQPACGLRFDHLFGQPQRPRARRGNILLALDGLPQVTQITNYVLNELAGQDKYRLKIRTHPVFPLEKFVGSLVKDPRLMPGVDISQGTLLQEDLVWADMVVYWGSAVSLEAVSTGKPVIHYDTGALLKVDPLFELEDLKWVAHHEARLVEIIDAIYGLSDEDYQARCRAAKGYIAAYFHQITPQALSCFEA